jgi:hypothetical protein
MQSKKEIRLPVTVLSAKVKILEALTPPGKE